MSTRIVVCDDESHIIRAIDLKLSRAGYAVETAPDGQAAWEAIERDSPAILVSDCQMPRLNGLELSRRLRSHEPTRATPIILLTAKGFELDDAELAAELAPFHLMSKPFSPRQLLTEVERLLGQRAPASRADAEQRTT